LTAAGTHDDRDVVPRWRPFGVTVRSGETVPLSRQDVRQSPADLFDLETAFKHWPGQHTASDLVGAALVSNTTTDAANAAAQYLLDTPNVSTDAAELAEALLKRTNLSGSDQGDVERPELDFDAVRRRARELRRIVRAEPRNAVRWADLALAHTVLGHPLQAERELRTALALVGPNRFLLRAATRLYVHLDRPDVAHDVLVRDVSVLADPWLAAAELATSALCGRSSRYMRQARRLVENTSGVAPLHLAELASQVATAELRAGHSRRAKQLMIVALRQPTDNALAQAEWASANGLTLDPASLDIPRTYEARALRFSHEGDWSAAAAAGMEWLADQPFAQEAAQFTSYAASVGAGDWKLAEIAARAGLVANPDDNMLRNNLTFALANQNRADEAATQFDRVQMGSMTKRDLAIHAATSGLIRFRCGDPCRGRALYRQGIESLHEVHETDLAALATAFWAREELLSGSPQAMKAVSLAVEAARSSGAPEARLWVGRILDDANTGKLGHGATATPGASLRKPRGPSE
jgi:tetratricopeptide (TPR) repeat protein